LQRLAESAAQGGADSRADARDRDQGAEGAAYKWQRLLGDPFQNSAQRPQRLPGKRSDFPDAANHTLEQLAEKLVQFLFARDPEQLISELRLLGLGERASRLRDLPVCGRLVWSGFVDLPGRFELCAIDVVHNASCQQLKMMIWRPRRTQRPPRPWGATPP